MTGNTVLRVVGLAVNLAALGLAVLFLAGFLGQFMHPARYPWVLTVWGYTRPVSRAVAGFIPTVYEGVDIALLIALIPLWVIWMAVTRGLRFVQEGPLARPQRRVPARPAEADSSEARPARARRSESAPVYRSEALLVIDLVRSSDLVSRFGNAFFFSLKQKLEKVVTPVAERHAVTYTENTGDGFLMCFPSVAHAAGAVREIYESLHLLNADLPEGAEAALRGAVNFGEVIVAPQGGNRTGTAVHKTFRLQSVDARSLIEAEGGLKKDEFPEKNYVVVSEEAVSAIRKITGFDSRFAGLAELKGLPGIHRVYQLLWDDTRA